jgi:Ca2+:H+ antiporter
MIVLNGMVGLSLLLGGWKHLEQTYNLQGANTYLGVIIPLAVLSVILPDYTETTAGPTLSFAQESTLGVMATNCAFLAVQTGRHRGYFTLGGEALGEEQEGAKAGAQSICYHVVMLAAYIVPVVYLAERLAHPVDFVTETLHAPAALSGIVIALLVATPEAIGPCARLWQTSCSVR